MRSPTPYLHTESDQILVAVEAWEASVSKHEKISYI